MLTILPIFRERSGWRIKVTGRSLVGGPLLMSAMDCPLWKVETRSEDVILARCRQPVQMMRGRTSVRRSLSK